MSSFVKVPAGRWRRSTDPFLLVKASKPEVFAKLKMLYSRSAAICQPKKGKNMHIH